MLLNTGLFGDFRLSTLICWRSTRISASSRALDRNSPVSANPSSKRKSIIVHEHHPIRPSASPVWGFRQGHRDERNEQGCDEDETDLDWLLHAAQQAAHVGNDGDSDRAAGPPRDDPERRCNPDRIGVATMAPRLWTARRSGASLSNPKCVRVSL
jgi:hypothetical protein